MAKHPEGGALKKMGFNFHERKKKSPTVKEKARRPKTNTGGMRHLMG